jgi:amidase
MHAYMHWLAIAYAPTMALACAAVLPCRRDHMGMPFGIQIIGPMGTDAKILEIACALEQVLSQDKTTAQPSILS